jgi:hypothetical protein
VTPDRDAGCLYADGLVCAASCDQTTASAAAYGGVHRPGIPEHGIGGSTGAGNSSIQWNRCACAERLGEAVRMSARYATPMIAPRAPNAALGCRTSQGRPSSRATWRHRPGHPPSPRQSAEARGTPSASGGSRRPFPHRQLPRPRADGWSAPLRRDTSWPHPLRAHRTPPGCAGARSTRPDPPAAGPPTAPGSATARPRGSQRIMLYLTRSPIYDQKCRRRSGPPVIAVIANGPCPVRTGGCVPRVRP